MIAWNDLQKIANSQRVSPFVVLREYVQILFLNSLYSLSGTNNIVFKGGTCLRLIHNSNRFSEDLDFTTDLSDDQIKKLTMEAVDLVSKETPPITVKTVKTISGFTQKLSMLTPYSPTPISVKLDFSQRELVLQKNQKPISSLLPISSFHPIVYMEMSEILAEKCRAIISRHKGRDIYDLWYLLQRKTTLDTTLIQKKLDYYQQKFNLNELIENISNWKFEKFDQDVRGFLPEPDRQILPTVISTLIAKLRDTVAT